MSRRLSSAADGVIGLSPRLIAVVGASGSGKTTVARQLLGAFNQLGQRSELISMDSYYKAVGHPLNNYDRPAAFDFDLLVDDLAQLKSGAGINVPTYDFVTHRRQPEVVRVEPVDVVLVEGLFLYALEELLQHFDVRIYLDVDPDTCFERRFKRDQVERGREPEDIRRQYFDQVFPGYQQYIHPSRAHATHQLEALPRDVVAWAKELLDSASQG